MTQLYVKHSQITNTTTTNYMNYIITRNEKKRERKVGRGEIL